MPDKQSPAAASLQRLPRYLAYLKVRQKQGVFSVSSTTIAEDLRLNPVQVRKDLALATKAGRPRTGYPLDTLIDDLESFLGYDNTRDAFVVGAGRLGRALMGNMQFAEYGLSVLAGFDIDTSLHKIEVNGKPIFPMEKLPDLVRRMRVQVAILAVPNSAAQAACDLMVGAGIRAIWNFATIPLMVPDHVILQHENLASSFAILSNRLSTTLHQEGLEGGNHP